MPITAWVGVSPFDIRSRLVSLGESGFDLHCGIDNCMHNNTKDMLTIPFSESSLTFQRKQKWYV